MGKDLKGKELGKGISQRKDGRYQARFTDRFGKRRCVYGITLKEVKNALMSEVVDNYSKNNVVDSNMTLDQWYEKWMRVYKEPVLKPSTIRIYIRTYHCYIKPVLGRLPLSSITKLMVTDLLNGLGKRLHKSTVNNIRTVLCDLFSYAMDNDLCTKNPAKGIKIIGTDKRKIVTLSREDQRDFFFMAKGCFYYNLYIVAVNTGLRSGDDDDKIRLNQRKPSKYKGLRRFGPEKNLQRINKFMKERPIFYKNFIQMKENFRFYLRCFYCITKVVILQFNSENRTELARNG